VINIRHSLYLLFNIITIYDEKFFALFLATFSFSLLDLFCIYNGYDNY